MIDELITALREQGQYSAATLAITAHWLQCLSLFFEPKPLLLLRPRDLAEWRLSLQWALGPRGKMYSANTVNQAIGAVRLFFRWALARGLVTEDPSKGLRTPRVEGKPWPRPAESEQRRLLFLLSGDEVASVRDRALFGLLFETGIPLQACSRLELGDLQTDIGALMASGRRAGVHSLGQGLTDDLERYLQRARPLLAHRAAKGEQALFLNSEGRPMSSTLIRLRLRNYRRKIAEV